MLRRALLEWCGPARCSDQLAVGMEFADVQHLVDQCLALRSALASDEPISPLEKQDARVSTPATEKVTYLPPLSGAGPCATGSCTNLAQKYGSAPGRPSSPLCNVCLAKVEARRG